MTGWPELHTYASTVLLDQVAEWVRPTVTSSDLGGQVRSDVTVSGSVPCHVWQHPTPEAADPARTAGGTTFTIRLPYGCAVETGDAFIVDGRRLEVVGVGVTRAGMLTEVAAQ